MRGKKVLVTGADGFIGSHLAERLVADGASVRTVCQYNSQGSWGWLDTIPAEMRAELDVRLGDIRDPEWVVGVCAGIDIVFHLAALIAIPYSYHAPRSFIDTNVLGTLNVLEAARRHSVQRMVHTSTSEVYGTPERLPIRETHPLNAQSPYAASKVAADQLALSFHCSFALPVTILRPFNTYGPRQSTRAVIPSILVQLLAKKEEIWLGRLDTKRDLTFVSDTVEGFVRAALDTSTGNVIQLGTGVSVSIEEVFKTACAATGRTARVRLDERRMRPDASEVLVLQSDPSRARAVLGWHASVALEAGLKKTAVWLADHQARFNADFLHL
jgi:NAD dependent epimerase/dehydratase